ncbi:hypothetical protein BDR07DRAFT_1375105 [Suillus spraguei]|nr:hypothetical protein BDR07DRAFT_1375105 [Suillus spraguei]
MCKGKGNSSTQDTEATVHESSHRPRDGVYWFLGKVKDGANKLRATRSKDSRSRSPAPPNVYHHECASSTPNIKAQVTPSGVEVEVHTQSALQDARHATKRMHPLSGSAITAVSVDKNAQADVNAADSFQDTYLKPLRIFDAVISEIANVCKPSSRSE